MFEQQLTAKIIASLQKKLPADVLRKGAEAMGKEAILINQERITNGLDVDGKPFKPRGAKYIRAKAKRIAGGKVGGGKFAASKASDWLRETGAYFRAMQYNAKNPTQPRVGEITSKFEIFLFATGSKDKGKFQGLQDRFKAFGIAKTGTRALRDKTRIINAGKKAMGVAGTGNIL